MDERKAYKMMNIKYTVVIPVKNEEENIIPLIDELEAVMKKITDRWELICIDDGSTDRTLSILRSLATKKSYLGVLSFPQNFGQSSAFAAGFSHARGEFIITMDGDRQNDPADIFKLIEKENDADLICGWRKERKDPWQKKITSKISNAVRSRFCRDGVHDTGCSLKLYRKQALQKIPLYHGMHRFLPALFLIEGFSVIEVPVSHRKRTKGKTKYHFFNRSLAPIIDMFVVRWMRKRKLRYEIRK